MGVAALQAQAPAPAPARPALQLVQRSCDCGGSAGLSGKCEGCAHGSLRPERAAGGGAAEGELAPPLVHQALAQAGRALDPAVRKKFEAELGHDFSKVRIHDGPLADASARAVGANAYAVGQDIVFRAGLFRPGTAAGAKLLAHELVHTTQQRHAPRGPGLRVGPANDAHERQARAAATALPAPAAPAPAAAPMATPRQAVQRDTAPAQDPGFLASLAGASADVLWGLVKKVAPGAVIDGIQAIRAKGIVGFLKDKLGGAFSGIFGGLSEGGAGAVAGLLGSFTQLLGAAKSILGALAAGDCKPLFDAVGKLGDTLGAMAGDAWEKLKSFLAPVGDFFSGLWAKFGAPAVDFITGAAADIWNGIKSFASQVWNLASALVAPAWNWLKNALGIGDGADGQNGVLQWVQQKLGEAWEAIKGVLAPVIEPMKAFAAKIVAVLPLDAILHLREKVHDWLGHAGAMVSNLQNPKGVTANQASLRGQILPAVKAAIVSLGGQISAAGGWVAAQLGGLVQGATQLFGAIKSNAILGAVSGAIDWVGAKVQALGDWVQQGVRGLFDAAGQGVAKLSGFVEPVLGVLEKLASVIGNVVKALPGLVMGPVWALIPACIKNPIKDFIIDHILSEIPIISTFVKLPDIWGKIQKLVLAFLTAVFVNGDLSGAALMVIRAVLEAVGVDVNLMLRVMGKAIATLDDIMMHPGKFLANIGGAIVAGFQRFWKNIGSNLFKGVQAWLLGPLASLGVTPMPDFSIGSIFKFVTQVLGLTMEKLKARLEKAIGAKAMATVTKVGNLMADAWHWISMLWTKGPGAVWQEIKGQLADLGTSMMAGLAAWIGGDLIKIGIAKLAKLSNPAGAVIELIQTIYKTVSFVVTKMNKILAMADAVLDSVGAIAAGNIGPAASAIERALVGAIGTVLAFLADWLGVSDPGEKLKGVVEKVQGKVTAAIDWLIAKALAMAQKLFSKAKTAVKKFFGWDDAKSSFKDGSGHAHTIFIKDSGGTPVLEIASDPVDAKTFVDNFIASQPADFKTGNAEKISAVYAAISESNSAIAAVAAAKQAGKDDASIAALGAQLKAKDDALGTALAALTGSANDGRDKDHPIDFKWVKPVVSGYPTWQIGATPYAPPLSATAKVGDFTIGVKYDKALAIAPDAVIQAGPKNTGNYVKDKTRDGLKKLGWNNAGLDVDHIWEKQIGGPDASENLWPLDSSRNQESGRSVLSERNRVMKQLNLTDLNGRFLRLKFGGG